jgi:hypothetical protein
LLTGSSVIGATDWEGGIVKRLWLGRLGNFTHYHSQFLAHRITLDGVDDDAFAKAISGTPELQAARDRGIVHPRCPDGPSIWEMSVQ